MDDYLKVVLKRSDGLLAWQKLLCQFVVTGIFAFYMIRSTDVTLELLLPFSGGKALDIGWLAIPLLFIVVLAVVNGVNFTDGLDGLASGITALVSFFMVIGAVAFGYLDQPILFGAVAGGCLGFLMFNKYPARIFMGDTGSMALGGVLSAGAVIMKLEFLLAVAGLIYVIEALSVVLQVTYYKKTKKRIFKMAPIHHHFELCGMKETKVVIMFWAFTMLFCLLAIVLMHL